MSPSPFTRPAMFPPGVKNLIIINVLMFLATQVSLFRINFVETFSMFYITSPHFHWWQVITHMFMHGGFSHIFFNMFALWMFGSRLENTWGTARFIFFYFVCGIGGILCHTLVTGYEIHHLNELAMQFNNHPYVETAIKIYDNYHFMLEDDGNSMKQYMHDLSENSGNQFAIMQLNDMIRIVQHEYLNTPVLGASGAVFGVLLGFGLLFPNEQLFIIPIPIPIRAKYLVFAYGAFEVISGFTDKTSNVAHFAHLGGMLFGLILILYWNKTRRNSFY